MDNNENPIIVDAPFAFTGNIQSEHIFKTLPTVSKQTILLTLDLNKIKIAGSSDNPKFELIFTNLVDTDMLYGHRNNWKGYGQAIEEIDAFLPAIMEKMTEDDILFITADHGCDPTVPGTDHTREQVPLLVYSKAKNFEPKNLGVLPSFAYVADEIKKWFGI